MKSKKRGAAGDLVDHWNHVGVFGMSVVSADGVAVLFWAKADGGGALPGVRAAERQAWRCAGARAE